MHSRADLLARLPAATAVLASNPAVLAAYVFGSVLDESRERVRDVDLAILGPSVLSFRDIGALCLPLGNALETEDIDIVDLLATRRGLRFEVLSKGVLLVDNSGGRLGALRERTLRENLAHRHREVTYYRLLGEALRKSYVRGR